jgi:hypothetical protein
MSNQLKYLLLKLAKYASFALAIVTIMREGEWINGN